VTGAVQLRLAVIGLSLVMLAFFSLQDLRLLGIDTIAIMPGVLGLVLLDMDRLVIVARYVLTGEGCE
jgi:hypothetical protein